MSKKYFEYRGVSNAVYAMVTADSSEAITFGAVKDFTGVAEIGRTTESSNEAHYYDNIPAIVIDSVGADEVTVSASGIPLDVLAELTGQYYDQATGMMVEQEGKAPYVAFGYKTEKTDGTTVYVWRLKGKFSIPATTSSTKNEGTDANGQEIVFTGINTTYKFTKTGKGAKAVNVDTDVNAGMTDATWFAEVQTPDTSSKETGG